MSVVDGKLWRCDVSTCGHVWYSPGEKPKRCSKCKSPYWDKTAREIIIKPKPENWKAELKKEENTAPRKGECPHGFNTVSFCLIMRGGCTKEDL